MTDPMLDPECVAVCDDLAELALGTLNGRDRARVLAHLEGCQRCALELERLSDAADALALLAPVAQVPAGFSDRVTAAMRAEHGALRPRRRRVLVAAAVLALVGLGVGLGAAIGSSGPAPPSMLSATLTSATGAHGEVYLTPGSHPWLVMTMSDVPGPGPITCAVRLADGKTETVGHFSLRGGYGSWSAPISEPLSKIRGFVVTSASGSTIATATLG
jgi:hypothetical protein